MTHEEIEEYIKSRNLDVMQYQLVIDAMCYAENAIIEKACERLESMLKSDLGYYGAADFADTFRKAMEE